MSPSGYPSAEWRPRSGTPDRWVWTITQGTAVVLGANYARSAPRRRQPRPRAHWCISKPDLQCGSGPRVQFSDDRCALCERGGSRLGDYLSLHGPGRRTVGRKGEVMPTKKSKAVSLPVVDPDAAGIDIGATQIFVAVPPDRDPEPVRCFQTDLPPPI